MNSNELYASLFHDYEKYKETRLASDFIKHSEVAELLTELGKRKLFRIDKLGKSVEGREIFSIVFGYGKTKILVWSQMHGDEPTATAALFDLFNFFYASGSFDELRDTLLENVTFHFIPMLNPDGAEKFRRENAFNIDLNRDAIRLQSYESKILWDYAEKVEPEFAFNLHDQNSYYTVGRTNNFASVSLLAPPMNFVKSVNYVREKSMQVVSRIYESLSLFIPHNIARYKDDHEPRSFGDNFTKNGISTILIESGFFNDDAKKDFLRKLNFVALLSAFHSIAVKNYEKLDHIKYFDIPENEELLFDLLLRNLIINYSGYNFSIDIGIKREKSREPNSNSFMYKGTITEIGDLSIFYGIEEYDLSGFEVQSEKSLAVDEKADFNILKNGKIQKKVINGFISDITN